MRILTPVAQKEREEFKRLFGRDGNCSCHISPPCPSCIHPGNPLNQGGDDEAWVEVEEEDRQ